MHNGHAGADPLAGEHRERLLAEVAADAAGCRNCPLWSINAQTVFGEGPAGAPGLFLGEAPGAHEDEAGRPFVGPAGQLFARALANAGIDRQRVYVSNTVKHRPWVQTAGRGKNRPPKQSEINACRPWLDRELEIVRPRLICCLGAVAGRAILGRAFKLTEQRGRWYPGPGGAYVLATLHPSFVLIQRDEARQRWMDIFLADIADFAEHLRQQEPLTAQRR